MTMTIKNIKTSGSDITFLNSIAEDMSAIESLLKEEIRSDVRTAYAISGHTLNAGGKRLRPALLALSARAVLNKYPAHTVHSSASAAELIHMASLIHDDVVDHADERRGLPTTNALYGNQMSVLVGDYLLAKSIHLASREGSMEVIRVFSNVTIGLSEGEVLQYSARGDLDTTVDTYLQIIEKKTARFISGCCEIGAMIACASEMAQRSLALYGHYCGMAFQIADDLLDYLGDPKETGKALDGDLRDGKLTLPLIIALQESPFDVRENIVELLQDPSRLTGIDVQFKHDAIARTCAYNTTSAKAKEYAVKAKDCLMVLPESPYRDSLAAIADYSITRRR